MRTAHSRVRSVVLLLALGGAALALEGRMLYLQLVDHDFLAAQGDDRHIRTVQMAAHRGPIVDRNGELLAVSTPVDSIWANPGELRPALDRVDELAAALRLDAAALARRITSSMNREFVYLARHLSPAAAANVLSLNLPGVYTQREYRRYYPAGEVTGHVLGFTDIDDVGQEGLELAFDYWLTGENGAKRVVRDRFGRIVEDVDLIRAPRDGGELRSSLDLRLQYLAYRELKRAVTENGARSGAVVILEPRSGEVLAMVNQPTFNPNDRAQRVAAEIYRNRAVTDIFEPGSAFKPFVIAAALESGEFRADSVVDTTPGYVQVGAERFEDPRNLGPITLTTLLARSSNVGAVKLALELKPEDMWAALSRFGIGQLTGSSFPGESAGVLHDAEHWRPVGQATQAFGYGLSVTTLQLARAYAAIANDGMLPGVTLLADAAQPPPQRVISRSTAADLLAMLEVVVSPEGSGFRAAVANYRIAGKTGTARKAGVGGYSDARHTSVFAGLAPASDPGIVVVVVIDEPGGEAYYGGDVAAPVFANIAAGALRALAVSPDALDADAPTVLAHARVAP
ncbi:MAG: penicillin-binding protein 2 [Gammaproteobacteria bacterium]|jgi:cell division protein FtsI (penicillin-binding protein 3)